jgi:hypothetical protein
MSSPPPAEHPLPLERLVGRLDVQSWLARRSWTPNQGLALGTPFLRALGLPAVLHLPALFVMGLFQTLVGTAWARAVNDAVVYVAFPVVEALCCVVLVACFVQRRVSRTLSAGNRAQSRFLGFLLAVLSAFGTAAGRWEPFAVSAAALLALLVPAPVLEPADGRPWWAA